MIKCYSQKSVGFGPTIEAVEAPDNLKYLLGNIDSGGTCLPMALTPHSL